MKYPCMMICGAIVSALSVLSATDHAAAQTYPNRAVRVIVPSSPGGAIDVTARVVSAKLSELWGQPVVIDNRPGATGTIGASVVAKAPADGYTLLHGTSNELVMNPYEKMPYNTQEDFAPISMMIAFPSVLVVHPSVPVKTLPQFVQFLRARPGEPCDIALIYNAPSLAHGREGHQQVQCVDRHLECASETKSACAGRQTTTGSVRRDCSPHRTSSRIVTTE